MCCKVPNEMIRFCNHGAAFWKHSQICKYRIESSSSIPFAFTQLLQADPASYHARGPKCLWMREEGLDRQR
jgi:hypothetical protein